MDSAEEEKHQGLKLKKVPWILSCRYLLAMMCFLGVACTINQRVNLSVGIVCMVNQTSLHEQSTILNLTSDNSDQYSYNYTAYYSSGNGTIIMQDLKDGEFDWSKSTQGIILGSFFWGYVFTQLPGGWLALRFGARKVIAISVGICSVLTLFTPLFARIHPILLICLRIVIGLVQGPMIPACVGIWTYWAPIQEKSQLMALTMSGVHIGNIITFPISALLCEYGADGGWPTIFYFSGGIGLLFVICWFPLIQDSPRKHRRISLVEKQYIEQNVAVIHRGKVSVPWKKVFTSVPYWAILVSHVSSSWLVFGFLICIPIYMKEVLKFDIKKNGLMSSIPFIGLWAMTVLSGVIADVFIRKGVRIQIVRKCSISIAGMLIPASICIALGYLNEKHWILAMSLLTIAVSLLGCLWGCGFAVNCSDIAPKYCSLLFGISNSSATVCGFVAPYFIAVLTKDQTQEEWRTVFFIATAVTSFGAIFYLIFGSGEVQEWSKSTCANDIIKDVGLEQLNVKEDENVHNNIDINDKPVSFKEKILNIKDEETNTSNIIQNDNNTGSFMDIYSNEEHTVI